MTITQAGPVVLIADDEPAIRRLYSRILSTAGFEVVEAVDGEDALAKLATIEISLVLLDAAMPRLDGLGLIRHLRADPATARLPIILVTGSGEEANRARGLDLSVDACLVKPIPINDLVTSVRAHARR